MATQRRNPVVNNTDNKVEGRNTVNGAGKSTVKSNLPGWIDWLILAVVALVSILSLGYTVASGALGISLLSDSRWTWDLTRAAGMTGYTLLAGSMLWGLFLSSRVIKDWSPGPLSLLLHATTSWLALVFAIAHAALLLFDNFYSYTLPDLLIPFIGPYRAFAVGLGVIALWLTLAITISFSLRKLIGNKAWLWLHYTSYIAFGLVTIHVLLAGTDAFQPGMRIILCGFAIVVVALLIWRVGKTAQAARR